MLMIGIYTQAPSSGGSLILDASPYLTQGQMSTNAHGAEACIFTILRDLTEAFKLYNQATVPYVGVFDGANLMWEGRLEDPTLQSSGYSGQALGYWRAFSDAPYTALWSSSSVANWRPDSPPGSNNPERYQMDTNNRIFVALQKNATYGNNANVGIIRFEQPYGGSRKIIGASFDYDVTLPNNWHVELVAADEGYASAAVVWGLIATGVNQTGAVNVTFTGKDFVYLQVYNGTGANYNYVGETGVDYAKLTSIRLVSSTANRVNTTGTPGGPGAVTFAPASMANLYVGQRLTIGTAGVLSESAVITAKTSTTITLTLVNGPYGGGTAITGHVIYADEIVKDLISTMNALNGGQIGSSTTLVQSPSLDLLNEVYEDRLPSDIIDYLASRGDSNSPPRMWEAGVTEGQIAYFRPRLSVFRAWYVDVTNLELSRTLNQLYNSAYGLYKDPNGRALRTAASNDAESVSRTGITRRTSAGADTTSSTQATTQRDTLIANNKNPLPRARIQFEQVFDASGAPYPLWMVRAGDTITVRNVPPNISSSYDRVRTFRITHTSYDLMRGTLDITPEVDQPSLAHLLARAQIGGVESPYAVELRG